MIRAAIVAILSTPIAVIAGGQPAHAGRASLHDIPWYVAHPAARRATLNVCHSDNRFAHDADCTNADTAETHAWAEERSRAAGDILSDPSYWASNRLGRGAVLAACANPPTLYTPETCAAPHKGEAMAPSGR